MTSPAIAVVIPTYGRAHLLAPLIESLAAQTFREPFEVVIVDDCSTDDTGAVLRKLATSSSLLLRVLRTDRNGGPAHARNLGWRATSAPLVAFTDDDCLPTADWLEQLIAALAGSDVVPGCTIPNPAQLDRVGPFSRTLDLQALTPFYETANIGYRRVVLERLHGFDETFLRGGEDTDLARRAAAGGATIAFCPTAIVRHEVHPSSFVDVFTKTKTYEGLVRLVLLYPDLRHHFDGPLVLSRRHRLAVLALGGVAIALTKNGRWWERGVVALLLLAPYAEHRVRRDRIPGSRNERVGRLPQVFAIDLAEVLHAVVARWRFRRSIG